MQTLFFDKDGTGNCFEACLASIFEIDLVGVPMFHDKDWFPRFYEWLVSKGFEYHGTIKPSNVSMYSKGVDGYFIVAGESPRGKHIRGGHAVVYKNGVLVHDPHPSGAGVASIKYGMAIEKDQDACSETAETGEYLTTANGVKYHSINENYPN